MLDFAIEDIEGSKNVFVDRLTRWAPVYRTQVAITGKVTALHLDITPSYDRIYLPDRGKNVFRMSAHHMGKL